MDEQIKSDEIKVFQYISNCETSSYTCLYAPQKVVVSTREIAKILDWTHYRTRKAIKSLVTQGLIERESCGNPAIESFGEYRELVYEAAPPKNGYSITKKGFESELWKDIYNEWSRSMTEWANGNI